MNPRTTLALAAAAASLLAGCTTPTGTDEVAPQGYSPVVLKENVFVVDGVTMTLTGVTDTTYTYGTTGGAPDVAAGDVLVDAAGGGHLRRVTAVSAAGGVLTLETTDAALTDALYRGAFSDTLILSLEGAGAKGPGGSLPVSRVNYVAPGVTVTSAGLSFADILLLDGTYGTAEVTARIASGSLTLAPRLALAYQVEGGNLWSFGAAVLGEMEFGGLLQVAASEGVDHEGAPVPLFSITHTFMEMLGPLPLVHEVTLEVQGICTVGLDSGLEATYSLAGASELGAGARLTRGGWQQIWNGTLAAGPGQAQWQGYPDGGVRCRILPVVTVKTYSMQTARVTLDAGLGFGGGSDGFVWSWELAARIGLGFAAELASLDPDLAPAELAWPLLEEATAASGSETIAGLIVQSEPAGARILLDGGSTGRVTPDTLTHFAAGWHEVRVYREGYNEHAEQVWWDRGFGTVAPVLAVPGYPRPVITVTSPEDSARFDDNVITVTGTVELDDGAGGRAAFDGDMAFLTFGGADQLVDVVAGAFSTDLSIFTGENVLKFRATGASGHTGVSAPLTVIGTFVPDDIVVTLSWNTPTSDIDLHVWNPAGQHCYFGNPQIGEGFLDIDDVEGYGPETFTATSAMNGAYVVKINAYYLDRDPYADASVTIWLDGGAPAHFGPHHFVTADYNGTDPAAWWEVTVFGMDSGKKCLQVAPLPPERIARMEAEMRSLPAKE